MWSRKVSAITAGSSVLLFCWAALAGESAEFIYSSNTILQNEAYFGIIRLTLNTETIGKYELDYYGGGIEYKICTPSGSETTLSCEKSRKCEYKLVRNARVYGNTNVHIPIFLWHVDREPIFSEPGTYIVECIMHLPSGDSYAETKVVVDAHPDSRLIYDALQALNFPRAEFIAPFFPIPTLPESLFVDIPESSPYRSFVDETVGFFSQRSTPMVSVLDAATGYIVPEQKHYALLQHLDRDAVLSVKAYDEEFFTDCVVGFEILDKTRGPVPKKQYEYCLPAK